MVRKVILYISLISFIFISTGKAQTVREFVHTYGFSALGDEVSTIFNNPAGLFFVKRAFSEFSIASHKLFNYDEFAIGYYLTRFPLFSRRHYTSINLGLGLKKVDLLEKYHLALGGTLVDFVKYGFGINRNKYLNETYWDADIGMILQITRWLNFGIVSKNFKNEEYAPFCINLGVAVIKEGLFKLTAGIKYQDSKVKDYSGGVEIDVFEKVGILGGITEKHINGGIAFKFTPVFYKNTKYHRSIKKVNREILFAGLEYNKREKEWNGFISFVYRFENFLYPPYYGKVVRAKAGKVKVITEEEEVQEDILSEQAERLERAKAYLGAEMIDEAKEEVEEVIRLGKNTVYGKEAQRLLRKIKRLERRMKRK